MNITMVGGVERNEPQLERLAAAAGHRLDFHGGHVGGRGALGLASAVERSDLVVIVMEVNSHGAVQLAKRVAKRFGKPILVLRTCGPARFEQLLAAYAARDARAAG